MCSYKCYTLLNNQIDLQHNQLELNMCVIVASISTRRFGPILTEKVISFSCLQ